MSHWLPPHLNGLANACVGNDDIAWDETLLPWDHAALGCHGRPIDGWDADTLTNIG